MTQTFRTHTVRSPIVALIAIAIVLPHPGAAQVEVPAMVVSASRLPAAASGLAQSVTLIGKEEIRANNPARLEDILSRAAGVYVDQVGKTGGFSSLYVRGAEQSHLLILVDGVKVNDPTTTRGSAYDLSAIDVNSIERIEILRGPASAIHGGEALAGVINIVTKRGLGEGPKVSVYGGAGQEGYRKGGVTANYRSQTIGTSAGAARSQDGEKSADAFQRLDSYSAGLNIAASETLQFDLTARGTDREALVFPDDSGGPQFAVVRDKERRDSKDRLLSAGATFGALGLLRTELRASLFKRDERSDSPGIFDFTIVPPNTTVTEFDRRAFQLVTTVGAGTRVDWAAGLEYQNEEGNARTDIPGFGASLFAIERTTKSVFGEAHLKLSSTFSTQLGLRHDRVGGIGNKTTPHVGLVWESADKATRVKGSYSRGFKPPSFFALGNAFVGNPNLRPERSKNHELIFERELRAGQTVVSASLFNIKYRDLVIFDSAISPIIINRGAIRARGIEPSVRHRFSDRLIGRLNLTVLDLDEQDGLPPLRNRPEKKASANLEYRISERYSLFGNVNYVGEFRDTSIPLGGQTLSDYTTLDVSVAATFKPVTVTFAVDNLLDERYQQFIGFPGLERRARLELRAEF